MAFAPQPAPATPYPDGAPGIQRSVNEVAQAMRDGRLDPDLRAWAIDVLSAAGLDGRNNPSVRAQATALLNALRAATIYVPDPSGAEWIQKPHVTLCLRDRCIRGGDCDDLTSALGGAMLSVGLSAYAVKADYGPSHQQHILNGVLDENGRAFYVDLSTNEGIQTTLPHVVEEDWINPLDMTSKATGTSAPELVTLGKPMKRELYYKGGHWFEFRYGQWWMHAGGKWLPGPVDRHAKGLPGMGRPFKRGGAFWAKVGDVEVELKPGQAGLGEIFGFHTPHELGDLLSALTYQVAQIQTAASAGMPAWTAADPAAANAWQASFNTALAAWTPVATKAQTVVDAAKTNIMGEWQYDYSIVLDGTQDLFDEVAEAFEPFESLDRQLRASKTYPQANLPTYGSTPQPTAPDLDLATYQIADSTIQKVKQIGSAVQERLEQASPYIAIAGAAVAVYAVYKVAELLPRRRKA